VVVMDWGRGADSCDNWVRPGVWDLGVCDVALSGISPTLGDIVIFNNLVGLDIGGVAVQCYELGSQSNGRG
jgi:hypothetical protein